MRYLPFAPTARHRSEAVGHLGIPSR